MIASAGIVGDRILNLWDRASGGREAKTNLYPRFGPIRYLQFRPKGEALVMAGASNDEGICWWEIVGGRFSGTANPLKATSPRDHSCAAMSPDGKVLATVSNNMIRLWDLREKPKKP